jgi:predicted CXXCH cytochrome family protein
LTAALAAVFSCTPEKRHSALTFFFDGVPPLEAPEGKKPAAKGTGASAATTAAAQAFTGSEHKPAAEETGCGICHNQNASFVLLKPKDDLCVACHAKETRQFPYMHGPAGIGACVECHDPHRSPLPHLVRTAPPGLCFQCHDRSAPGAKPPRCARPSDDARCTDCHNPHGGAGRYFLVGRPGEVPGGGKPTAPEVAPEAR